MYVFAQNKKLFVDSNLIKNFCVDECTLKAENYILGEYSNESDAIKVLNEIFNQIVVGSESYQVI